MKPFGEPVARVSYQLVRRGGVPIPPTDGEPFVCAVIARRSLTADDRYAIAEAMIGAGCLAMSAWGEDATLWDDSFDWVCVMGVIEKRWTDEFVVMTSWWDGLRMDEFLHWAHRFERPYEDEAIVDHLHIVEFGDEDRWPVYRAILDALPNLTRSLFEEDLLDLPGAGERWPLPPPRA